MNRFIAVSAGPIIALAIIDKLDIINISVSYSAIS
jgi:hypothetical protein